MSDWPAIKTPAGAHKHITLRQWAVALFGTWVLVPAGTVLLAFALKDDAGLSHRAFDDLFALFPMLYLLGVLSLPVLCIGVVCLRLLLRAQYGGWMIALTTGVVLLLLFFRLWLGTFPTGAITGALIGLIGAIYAGVFWFILRLRAPNAFVSN